jgi:hypothetical protein
MMRGLRFALVSAIFLVPFTFPRSALSLDALTYQEAVVGCYRGYVRACEVMNAYQAMARGRLGGGSPADRWVGSDELRHGGLRGVRPGVLSTYDFVR